MGSSTVFSDYADGDTVTLRLASIETATIDPTLLDEGLQSADDYINATVPGSTFTTPIPFQITRAATYYAVMTILDILFSDEAGRNPVALSLETLVCSDHSTHRVM